MSRVASPGIILPAGVHRGLSIAVPSSYMDRVEREQVKIGVCRICGARFYKGQETTWQRHVGWCARQHEDELRAGSPRRIPVFDPDRYDTEASEHLGKVGRRMREEGRLEMKPNEYLTS